MASVPHIEIKKNDLRTKHDQTRILSQNCTGYKPKISPNSMRQQNQNKQKRGGKRRQGSGRQEGRAQWQRQDTRRRQRPQQQPAQIPKQTKMKTSESGEETKVGTIRSGRQGTRAGDHSGKPQWQIVRDEGSRKQHT